MSPTKKNPVTRRDFLRNAAAGAAVLVATPETPGKQPISGRRTGSPPPASPEAGVETPSSAEVLTADRTGSDFMVDVIKSLGIDYICSNPGVSFRGLHESVINYGGNKSPEFITCMHEESSVAMMGFESTDVLETKEFCGAARPSK